MAQSAGSTQGEADGQHLELFCSPPSASASPRLTCRVKCSLLLSWAWREQSNQQASWFALRPSRLQFVVPRASTAAVDSLRYFFWVVSSGGNGSQRRQKRHWAVVSVGSRKSPARRVEKWLHDNVANTEKNHFLNKKSMFY